MNQTNIDKNQSQEAILSGYVRYRPINKTFYLMVNSRRLANFVRTKENIKVKVHREGQEFRISLDQNGNILKPRSREVVTCIGGRNLLSLEERNKLQSKNSALSFTTLVKLKPVEFGLSLYSLYPDEDAALLAEELENQGVTFPDRIMTPYTSKFDLDGKINDKEITIEITKLQPSIKDKSANFKHQSIGGNIRSHIFDTYRRGVKRKLENNTDYYGFVIIDQKWEEYEHIKDLIEESKQFNCFVLGTLFKNNWVKEITTKIKEMVG